LTDQGTRLNRHDSRTPSRGEVMSHRERGPSGLFCAGAFWRPGGGLTFPAVPGMAGLGSGQNCQRANDQKVYTGNWVVGRDKLDVCLG
jgi:hypothetical protein